MKLGTSQHTIEFISSVLALRCPSFLCGNGTKERRRCLSPVLSPEALRREKRQRRVGGTSTSDVSRRTSTVHGIRPTSTEFVNVERPT